MRVAVYAVLRVLFVALVAVTAGGSLAACGVSSAHRSATAAHRSSAARVRAAGSPPDRGGSALVVGSTPIAAPIAPGFVGLSLGYKAVELYAGADPAALDPVFEQLVRNLSPGQSPVLRVAGADQVWWPVPHMARPPGVNYNITAGLLEVIRALAQALGARLILGVNFEADSATLAGAEARALVDGIGRERIGALALELGNEPELYSGFGYYRLPDGQAVAGRRHDWSFGDLVEDFASISRSLPRTVTLAGPALGSSAWIPLLGQFLAGNPRLGLVTLHRYPLKHCSPNVPVTIPELLSGASSTGLAESVAQDVAISHVRGTPLRIGEMGAVACGGMPGVSDSFASALWSLDALFAMARVDVDGVNLQTARNPNELFALGRVRGRWQADVRPVYYGAMMFAQAAPAGSRLLALSGTAGADLNAWATRTPAGEIHVVLINDDTHHARTVTVRIPALSAPATLERLEAPGVQAQSGVTLGGQSFGAETYTGLLAGTPSAASVTPVAGDYVVRLPAASAAMLTLPAG